MMNISWLYVLLQRPLVTILLFTVISACILILLQIIAGGLQYEVSPPVESSQRDGVYYQTDTSGATHAEQHDSSYASSDLHSLSVRIEDLKRIKLSVRDELKLLQNEKTKLLKEKASLISKNDKILAQINKNKLQLKQYELDLTANEKQRLQQTCSADIVTPVVFNPLKSTDISRSSYEQESVSAYSFVPRASSRYQFDLAVCSLTKRFDFNLSSDHVQLLSRLEGNIDAATLLLDVLMTHNSYLKRGSHEVCMTVTIMHKPMTNWTATTRNNLIINLSDQSIDHKEHHGIMSKAIIASPSFKMGSFRHNLDLVIPSRFQAVERLETILGSSPLQSPLRRKYLASYFGSDRSDKDETTSKSATDRVLRTIHRSSIDDLFLFIYNCGRDRDRECYDNRERMIEMSTFLIIIVKEDYDIDRETNNLIYLALSRGSIPVIFGIDGDLLPFGEAIDWRLGSLILPLARLPEVHLIIRTLGPSDLYTLKYHGRRIFEQYLVTSRHIVDAILSLTSLNRLNYPPSPIESTPTSTYYNGSELTYDTNCTTAVCMDARAEVVNNLLTTETLGPREKPFRSLSFSRNYSLALTQTYNLWNEPLLSPKHLFPSHPNDPVCPSEYKFISMDQSFRPINDGIGGSGLEFSQALGGDYPNEQFTIILLTYERVPLLMRTLERLKGLAYLNKILVVWNGINQKPRNNLVWPDIGVPIEIVKVEKNSLNNRFLPYDLIETDAIFSMDDDSPLRPDEIVFAFRVWRESRDRIVGFPGRFHAWDAYQNSWMYNSNHSCELSMVLTGGAFFHKYYSYVYSQVMPETIRTIVDKFMNCEDIAMNFLVAHLTRKPPIKVTSRWTFHCTSCTTSLSEDNSHFMERHECLNIFTSIYGYMPLVSTQHRSDSILFKTRLPKDKQKCFKFV